MDIQGLVRLSPVVAPEQQAQWDEIYRNACARLLATPELDLAVRAAWLGGRFTRTLVLRAAGQHADLLRDTLGDFTWLEAVAPGSAQVVQDAAGHDAAWQDFPPFRTRLRPPLHPLGKGRLLCPFHLAGQAAALFTVARHNGADLALQVEARQGGLSEEELDAARANQDALDCSSGLPADLLVEQRQVLAGFGDLPLRLVESLGFSRPGGVPVVLAEVRRLFGQRWGHLGELDPPYDPVGEWGPAGDLAPLPPLERALQAAPLGEVASLLDFVPLGLPQPVTGA